jgi:regulator of protease activity HflC (stomatin/prohibitin superfamily)
MQPQTLVRRVVLAIAFVLPLVIAVASSCTTVDAGHVGVVRTFGAVKKETLPEGIHLKKPWESVVEFEVRLRSLNNKAAAASKDLQTVTTEITIQYSPNAAMVSDIYRSIGDLARLEPTIVAPAVQESLKSVTAQFTAEELITQRQRVKGEVETAIRSFIDVTLQEKGLAGAIDLANIAITDFKFSEEFNKAIEAKVKAEQEALKAVNEKTRRITDAEATNAEQRLTADAKAYATEVESKARAAAIQREAEALKASPEVIQLRAIERWNGVLPSYLGGSTPMPFVTLPNAEPEKTKPAK